MLGESHVQFEGFLCRSFILYVQQIKLAIREVGHQLGVVKLCEGTRRTCHITISDDMLVGLNLATQIEVKICDATLFQVCCTETSS